MEHIPSGNINTRIEVPLVGVLEYDGGDFNTYPARHGWDEEMIFCQLSVYFKLLISLHFKLLTTHFSYQLFISQLI